MYIDIIIVFILLVLGYVFGSMNERRHYKSIMKREQQYQQLFVHNSEKRFHDNESDARLVMGSVVISIDYFKRLVAGLRNLFGGQVSTYESLLDRGRREALLRLQEESMQLGAVNIKNVRYETSSISKNARGSIGSIEVLAYGTAVIPKTKTP